MKLYLDSADISEVEKIADTGLLNGVTTNPSLVAKQNDTNKSHEQLIKDICEISNGFVSAEVISTDYENILEEGKRLAEIHHNVVVKTPLTIDGLKATKVLAENDIRVNVTLCFSANQALLAANAGAWCVSPFVGRLDDIGENSAQLIKDIRKIYDNYKSINTKILAASIRHPKHVFEAAKAGADIATMPYSVFTKLYNHPLTEIGLKNFLRDAGKP